MRSTTRLLCLGGALPTVAVFADGCRTATEVTLELGTNVVCADMRGVDIVVADSAHAAESRAALLGDQTTRYPSASTSDCSEGAAPRRTGSLVVTPSGSEGAIVVVAAFGSAHIDDCKAPNFAHECIVARRRFAFIDHQAVTLPVVLDPSCAGVPCNESSTCVGKKCVDSEVQCGAGTCGDPGVEPDGGPAPEVDGASPLDATSPDANDGSITDAPPDGPGDSGDVGDGGTDAGGGSCAAPICLDSVSTACPATKLCCYAASPAICIDSSAASCPAIVGCCRGASDCSNGDICCASTTTPGPGTRVTCQPRGACPSATSRVVCSSADLNCGPGHTCLAGGPPSSDYSTMPEYFNCS